MNFKDGNARFIAVIVIALLVFSAYLFVLFKMQVIDTDYYKKQSESKIYSTESVSASRGNICDRNGQLLVTNETVYTITFSRALMPVKTQDSIILSLCRLLSESGESYYDTLPISGSAPYSFTYEGETAEKQISELIERFRLSSDATAAQVMEQLIKKYKIDTSLTTEEKRIIAGVRYEMERSSFSASNPYTFASDVSINTVTAVKELSDEYPGVDIGTESKRVYTTPYFASHILGRTGKIYAEEYKDLREKGYKMNEYVGKDGIEKAMEDYLRGTDGVRVIERDSRGKVLNVTTVRDPISGNNVILTLDKDLQQVAQTSLEATIKNISDGGKNKKSREGADACAGAAVAIAVDSGEILASASAPNFDLVSYLENYNALVKDEMTPMFNRAFNGTYAPGSTFKMATGIAGLEEGYITTSTKIRDLGIYKKYTGYQPRCWVYSDYGTTHGSINVSQALEKSCNYFFYETADMMGIDHLNTYCAKLGLGSKTGVEISESSGVLAGPEYRKKIDSEWYPGDTLQAAIGQSDNLFTPLQLANYVATIVNGGTRYKAHLVKSVNNMNDGSNVAENSIQAVETLEMQEDNYHAIMYGMKLAADSGTASTLFSNYKVGVGAKTGTASVPSGTANGIFVAFAPYENPEIAVCVVVEHGAHGNYVGAVAKAIFDEYFNGKSTNVKVPAEEQLIY